VNFIDATNWRFQRSRPSRVGVGWTPIVRAMSAGAKCSSPIFAVCEPQPLTEQPRFSLKHSAWCAAPHRSQSIRASLSASLPSSIGE
jgi:hypothetical protein